MKTITLTEIAIKEIHLARDGTSYVISVLYAQTDANGKEYESRWSDPIKGAELPDGIDLSIEKVFTKVSAKIKLFENI